MRPILVFLVVLIVVPLTLAGALYGLFLLWGRDLPSPQSPTEVEPSHKTTLLDRHGALVEEYYIENRSPLPLAQIPELMRQAVLATEDRRFFHHWGIDVSGIIRAVASNFAAGGIRQGASTITQQLARNAFLSHSVTFERKIKEAILAVRLERSFSKEEILEFYLNRIYFGEGAYGVEAAAQRYFGRPCTELTLAETALLAGLPGNPTAFSPLRHPEAAVRRRNLVLRRMETAGVIDAATRRDAEESPLALSGGVKGESPAAYFSEMVRIELMERFGGSEVYEGGLTVYTTLDMQLQEAATDAIERQLREIEEKEKLYYRRKLRVGVRGDSVIPEGRSPRYLQGALVAIEPQNGAIRSLVGGRSFDESHFNRAVQAHRQPGSAFKPIVFAEALRHGYHPNSMLEDSPITFRWSGQSWSPKNFDHKFRGAVTMRYALQKSINVPAIRLLEAVGVKRVIDLAHQLGIKEQMAPHLSLALGTAEVTPLELTSAYSCFANHGILAEPHAIERIEDRYGRVVYEFQAASREVLDEKTSYQMVSLLRSVVDHGTGWPARGKMDFRAPAGGKTGTTDDYTDAWFVGFVPRLCCGVWVGFDEKRTIGTKMTGAAAALPAWVGYMKEAVKVYGEEEFSLPSGMVSVQTCAETGLLAVPGCPKVINDACEIGRAPTEACAVHAGLPPVRRDAPPAAEPDDEAPSATPDPEAAAPAGN